MTEIIRNRTIRPTTRLEKLKNYKSGTKAVSHGIAPISVETAQAPIVTYGFEKFLRKKSRIGNKTFRTTNCIENVNSLLQQLTHNVRRWTNSAQRHRWVATALLDIEPRLRRIKGCRHLPMLRQALQTELGIKQLAMVG